MGRQLESFTLADLSDPQQFRGAVQNVANVYDATPEQVRQAGRQWYERVHEATAKGTRNRGLTVEQGAGVVAAVSPNMDWERGNIKAFDELTGLRESDWGVIQRSSRGQRRSHDARTLLQGLSVSSANDRDLLKAHRIMQGEDVETVLPRRTAPKTNSFARNISNPAIAGPVTIDGRAHDVAVNQRVPWKRSRGLKSASLPSGKKTRYEHFEDAYRGASSAVGVLPHEMQAVVWEGGRAIERYGVTKSGRPRKIGVPRVGQPYV